MKKIFGALILMVLAVCVKITLIPEGDLPHLYRLTLGQGGIRNVYATSYYLNRDTYDCFFYRGSEEIISYHNCKNIEVVK